MSYISPSTVVVAPVTRKKLFLLDKTCEMQIFRPQYIIVLNFNQKTLLDKRCQVLCVLDSFYHTRRHPAPVSVLIPERYYKFCGHWSQQCRSFVFKLLCRISRWKPGYTRPNPVFVTGVCVLLLCFLYVTSRAGEAKNTYDMY